MYKRTKLSLVIQAATMALPVAVYAQNGPSFELEEVIVTATRRASSVMQIPSNISAVGGEALDKAGITDFSKLTRNIPGLAFSDTGPRNNGISGGLIMRGMNAQSGGFEDFYRSSDPAVSTYIGETPLFVNLNMRDIDRVEVLRGPQGTLYGSGSLGGTVRYIQKRPETDNLEAHVAFKVSKTNEADDFNTDTEMMLNVPVNDNLAVRMVMANIDNAGFIDAVGIEGLNGNKQPTGVLSAKDNINGDRVKYARFALLWDINEAINLQFNHQRQQDEVDGRQAYSKSIGQYQSGIKRLEPFSRDVEVSSVDIEADLGFATLTSSSSYYRNEAQSTYDQSYNYPAQGFWAYYAGIPRDVVTGLKEYETDAFVQELRLVSNGESDIDWVLGGYSSSWHGYSNAEDIVHGLDDLFGIVNPQLLDLSYNNVQKDTLEDTAIFGELTYHISDVWQVTVGVRAFDQTFESSQRVTLPACGSFCGEGIFGLSEGAARQDFKDEIFKINTSYEFSNTMMVYATWAEGFRHGGSNGLPVDNPNTAVVEGGIFANDISLMTFDADTASNFELGVKGRMLDNHLELSGAVFNIDWKGNQVLQRAPEGGFPIVLNLGESQTRGVELEVKAHFTQSLSVSLGYAYVVAQTAEDFSGLPDLSGTATLQLPDGTDLPGVPTNTMTVALDYSITTDNGMEWVYLLGGFYKDSFTTDFEIGSDHYDEVGSQVVIDTSLLLYVEQWRFSLYIDNLLNSEDSTLELGDIFYGNYAGTLDPTNRLEAGDVSYVVRPRTVGIGVKYAF